MAEERSSARRGPTQVPMENTSTPAVRHVYFNGFELGMSLSDAGVWLLLDGQPQCRITMSFTTAKTLALALADHMRDFEAATQHTIMTMADVQMAVDKKPRSETKQ
jgi:hypothetical protein